MNDTPSSAGLALTANPPGRRVVRGVLWTALVLLIVFGAYAWQARDRSDRVQYRTEPAQRGNLVVTVTATGSLAPTNQVDVGIEISGTVRAVEADYNDQVKVGQVLARLDTTKLEAQVLQTQAALEAARARVLQAQASVAEAQARLARLERVKELSGGKVPSPQEIDTARATLDRAHADDASARAQVTQTEAALNANRTDLAKAVIHSPVNGIVLKRAVEPGQTVAAVLQAPVLFTLAEDLTKMELQVDVDEADVGKVHAGQEATFTVDAYPERTFPARITKVRYGSQTVAGVVTYKALLKVDNAALSLRPGMTATASIVVDRVNEALLVPNAALRFTPPAAPQSAPAESGGLLSKILPRAPRPSVRSREDASSRQKRVWTVQDGELQPIDITIGATNGVMTQVVAGTLAPGTALVVDRVQAPR